MKKKEKFSNPIPCVKDTLLQLLSTHGPANLFLLLIFVHSLNYKPDGSRNFLYLALHTKGDLHITVSAMYCMPTICYV